MENCEVPVHLQDHSYQRQRKISARARKHGAYSQCPCCRNDQPPHSATASRPAKKRQRTSKTRPSKASVEPPAVQISALAPQPSSPAVATPSLLGLVPRPRSTISPDKLPVVSNVAPDPRPSTAPQWPDNPLRIHNYSVEEYQKIYHEVVDDMLMYKNGRPRPYSLQLGRCIKQKLWERLNRPMFTETVNEDGRVHVDVSYGVGVYPPLIDVDISDEPQPETPPNKRAKKH